MERRIESGMPGWKVARRIGEGSYSVVYEIERDNFGTIEKAAIKVISIPHSESEITEYLSNGYDMDGIASRFLERMGDLVKEYNTMVRLKDCPNIVHCDDYVTLRREDNVGWYSLIRMELLRPLPAYLGSGAIEEKEALHLGLDIANALVRCRKEGIIHRDIKPHNIFVGKDGTYKLGDFGVARSLDHSAGATMIGTFNYMAPEVIQQKRYGFRADLYSLGLVLYWMLNERRGPFLPLPPKMNTALQEEEARAKRFSGEQLPPPKHGSARLKEIVLRACAYAPEDRYRSAEEMYADLYSLAENKTPKSYLPIPNPAEKSSSSKINPVSIGMKIDDATQPAESSHSQNNDATQLAKGTPVQTEEQTQRAASSASSNDDRTQLAGATDADRNHFSGHALMQDNDRTQIAGSSGNFDNDRTQFVGNADVERTEFAGSVSSKGTVDVPAAEHKPESKKKNRLVVIAGSLGIAAAIVFLIAWRFLLPEDQTVLSTEIETAQPTVSQTLSPEPTEELSPVVTAEPTPKPTEEPTPEPTETPAPVLTQYSYRVDQVYNNEEDGLLSENYDEKIEGEVLATTETALTISVPESAYADYVFEASSPNNVLTKEFSDPAETYTYQVIYVRHIKNPAFAIPENMKGIRISAGHDHSIVLRPDRTVLGFGSNVDDRNTRNVLHVNQSNVSGWSDIIDVSAGEYHSVGLRADGTVVSVGQDKEGQRNLGKWTDIVDIAAGEYHTVGLRADGSLVAAGRNKKGQCEVQSLLYAGAPRVIAVAAGYEHTIVLRENGTVSGIGDNSSGQRNVNDWTEIVSIDCGTYHTVGLRADGTVIAVGDNEKGQCNVSAWTDIIAIAAGDYFTVGLRSDGTVVAVGLNDEGQCNVEGWTDIVAIGAGNDHTLGVKIDGSGIGTGRNDKGQLAAFHVFS